MAQFVPIQMYLPSTPFDRFRSGLARWFVTLLMLVRPVFERGLVSATHPVCSPSNGLAWFLEADGTRNPSSRVLSAAYVNFIARCCSAR